MTYITHVVTRVRRDEVGISDACVYCLCLASRDEILCSRPIDMDQHSIKNVKNPVERFDAVDKAYVDRVNINHLLVLFLILF